MAAYDQQLHISRWTNFRDTVFTKSAETYKNRQVQSSECRKSTRARDLYAASPNTTNQTPAAPATSPLKRSLHEALKRPVSPPRKLRKTTTRKTTTKETTDQQDPTKKMKQAKLNWTTTTPEPARTTHTPNDPPAAAADVEDPKPPGRAGIG